ncbi:putative DnaJ subfamily C member 27-B [Monoraphidium neglectum]|uniref:Putative DnaJ subfamily C member 27-B n=1 Tax=Monoraphidium neglectum TaxID=145388 RepID=A0A0D2KJU6_9CHLO|nr:putative DnaJ subfamily C member 27-B [Monoraphidium neglectum]KIY96103.1 putative DnaJ subfamily C member 27-B [Monoraphidium neglectum]|eukprot:XP_013895123.1 putative DnaJ subfamily C member 27-B [Monoraphidium neglectum]
MQDHAPQRQRQGRAARTRMVRIKVVSLGDCGVGKSCLIKRYCEGKFISKYIPTIGVDYGVKPVKLGDFEASSPGKRTVRVNLWDMAGPDDYLEVRNEFYRDTQGALLVFDVGSRVSFEALPRWLDEARCCGAPRDMVVCVVGTKADAAPASRRVPEQEARDWALARGLRYFEVSALTGASVGATFATLFAQVLASTVNVPQDAVARAECEAELLTGGAQ